MTMIWLNLLQVQYGLISSPNLCVTPHSLLFLNGGIIPTILGIDLFDPKRDSLGISC